MNRTGGGLEELKNAIELLQAEVNALRQENTTLKSNGGGGGGGGGGGESKGGEGNGGNGGNEGSAAEMEAKTSECEALKVQLGATQMQVRLAK